MNASADEQKGVAYCSIMVLANNTICGVEKINLCKQG